MKTNSEMVNSGVDWLGEIPSHWELRRARYMFRQSTSKGNNRLVLLSATQDRGVVDKSTLDSVVQVAADADLSLFKTVHKNDFVISLRSFQGGFEISHEEGVISPAYTVFRLTQQEYPHYYRYLFKSYGFIDKINSLTVGIREGKNIQYVDFSNMLLPYFALEEQQKIASFLDKKCAEVDEMIALQEQIIEELKAYKQSVITEAVTKGLNPAVPMKDSGIEWIGQIPEHWEVCKIKNSLKINPPQCHKLEEDTEVSYMPMECLRNGVIEKRVALYGSLPSLTEFSDGDIVMAKVTPCFENGNIAIASDLTNGVGFGSSEVFVFRCHDNTLSNYAFYYLQSPYVKARGVSSMTGTGGLKRVNPHYFCDSVMLLPSYFEQQEIADYLDTKCTEIDNLISIKLSKIDSLKEYKKSIIYEYVTGKKEVTE